MTKQNFSIPAGDTREIEIAIASSDPDEELDLIGATAAWHMSKNYRSNAALIERRSADANIALANVDGVWILSFKINAADTKDLFPADYYHDAVIVDAQGNVSTVTVGSVTIVGDYTARNL